MNTNQNENPSFGIQQDRAEEINGFLSTSLQKSNLLNQQILELNNSFGGIEKYSSQMASNLNSCTDQALREGEKTRHNIFKSQDSGLNHRNTKVMSQTVFDCLSDYSANRQTNKEFFDQNQNRFFEMNQNSFQNINSSEIFKQRPTNIKQIGDPILNSQGGEGHQKQELDPNFNHLKMEHFKLYLTKHHSQDQMNSSSQKDLNVFFQNGSFQQDSSSGPNPNNLNQQQVSRASQKHSSFAVSYSSNQNGSVSHHLNDSSNDINDQNENQGNSLIVSQAIGIQNQKGFLKQKNQKESQRNQVKVNQNQIQSIQSEVLSNKNQAQNNDISIMEIVGPDQQNEQQNIRLNMNQTLQSNIQQNTDDIAMLELRKKRQSRYYSVAQQTTTNKFSFKFFKKANLIKKFILNMVSILPSRVFQKLEYRHFHIIGDNVFRLNNMQQQNELIFKNIDLKSANQNKNTNYIKWQTTGYQFKKAMNKSQGNFIENLPIIQPNGMMLMGWNIFLLIFLLVQLTVNPFLSVFEESRENKYLLLVTEPIAIGVLLMQIVVNLNTGFYNEGQIIKSRMEILKKYCKYYLWVDALTIAFILIAFTNIDYQFFKMIYLFRILQVNQILNSIEEHFQLQQKYYTAYELSKLFALVFFVAHYCGCFFYLISRIDYENNVNQESWIKKYNVATESWEVIYLDSLYFSFITMVTVGYGDIVPISSNEKIYVILFSIVSCGIFGYAVNTIGSIFHELSQKQANYKYGLGLSIKTYQFTQSNPQIFSFFYPEIGY